MLSILLTFFSNFILAPLKRLVEFLFKNPSILVAVLTFLAGVVITHNYYRSKLDEVNAQLQAVNQQYVSAVLEIKNLKSDNAVLSKKLDNQIQETNKMVQNSQDEINRLKMVSSREAISNANKTRALSAKLDEISSRYSEILKQRNEQPGVLSNTAVETINNLLNTETKNATPPPDPASSTDSLPVRT